MDRREALKKLAGGGAVLITASAVSSSPVFAAGSAGPGQPMGPGLSTSPLPSLSTNGKRLAVFQLTSPGMTCGDAPPRIDSFAVVGPVTGNLNVSVSPSGPSYMVGASTALVTVSGTGPGRSPFRKGDAFEVTWHVRYVCLVNGVEAGGQCRNYTYRYVNQANGNPNWQPALGSPTMTSGCA